MAHPKLSDPAKQAKLEYLLNKYNRKGVETNLRLQGEFNLRTIEEFDELDPEWTETWLTWIYDRMYNRGRLDERTRILVIIGECCVLDEQVQLPNHIRSALRVGATKEEIWEVIVQSHIYAGMPKMIKAMRTYRSIMKDLGHLDLNEPVFRGDAREEF
jgi:alkylhydroperoxidase/carboxymuconolactone decarboxylase family protein YurZ